MQIQEAVRDDKLTINKAYKLIRDMELGKDEATDKVSVEVVKAARVLFNEENFAILKELGGDLSSHVNRAAEMYIRSMQGREDQEPLKNKTLTAEDADVAEKKKRNDFFLTKT